MNNIYNNFGRPDLPLAESRLETDTVLGPLNYPDEIAKRDQYFRDGLTLLRTLTNQTEKLRSCQTSQASFTPQFRDHPAQVRMVLLLNVPTSSAAPWTVTRVGQTADFSDGNLFSFSIRPSLVKFGLRPWLAQICILRHRDGWMKWIHRYPTGSNGFHTNCDCLCPECKA
jgi:hypothetical protein